MTDWKLPPKKARLAMKAISEHLREAADAISDQSADQYMTGREWVFEQGRIEGLREAAKVARNHSVGIMPETHKAKP
jgi:hypothetical protein